MFHHVRSCSTVFPWSPLTRCHRQKRSFHVFKSVHHHSLSAVAKVSAAGQNSPMFPSMEIFLCLRCELAGARKALFGGVAIFEIMCSDFYSHKREQFCFGSHRGHKLTDRPPRAAASQIKSRARIQFCFRGRG